ncbi:cation:proton antiporter [Romeria aff. gracilis LEGE 07310]|uniref:Cation:proton antiporter n=1 Tax=Vasconcelosia minhoensis LEGE 07310 TaxID=915328 RepID=A0A8J7AKJ8_9CYAN|nr:cation:proton antiporter [Romeria gracilis]MBE9076389.1 cation:proton antiporter [Romeria aff. gracilis LEGE 07310]
MDLPLTRPVYVFGLILLIIQVAPVIAIRLRLPPLAVLIILGAVFGSNGLGLLERDAQLILLETIGLLYIMLIAGMQMDLSDFRRLGARSLIFGLLTFGIPLAVGIGFGKIMAYGLLSALLVGILYSPHTLMAYPIMTRLGIAQREVIGVTVGGTVVTSILTLIGLSIVQATTRGNVGILLWIKLLVLLPCLVMISFWLIPKLGRFVFDKSADSLVTQFGFVLTCLFALASATLLLEVDSIVGAFIAGLSLNRLVPINSPLMKQIEFVGNSLFIPAFMVSVGVLSNPSILVTNPGNLGFVFAFVVAALGAKLLAAWIAGELFHYSPAEIMTMFSLTVPRAALVLVIALFGQEAGLINEALFNAVVAYIVLTCLLGPLLTDGFGRRVAAQASFEKPQT